MKNIQNTALPMVKTNPLVQNWLSYMFLYSFRCINQSYKLHVWILLKIIISIFWCCLWLHPFSTSWELKPICYARVRVKVVHKCRNYTNLVSFSFVVLMYWLDFQTLFTEIKMFHAFPILFLMSSLAQDLRTLYFLS